jgi:aminopeptidase N
MHRILPLFGACLLLSLSAAAGAEEKADKPPPPVPLDASTRDYHQRHLHICVEPDIRAGSVTGRVVLDFESLVDGLTHLRLHCLDTQVRAVADAAGRPLAHRVEAGVLEITLPGPLAVGASSKVEVRYESKPTRGLFFHAPGERCPDRPLFMYSQGQGTDNRRWIPCYDEPDDRCSWQLEVTAEADLETVSNGVRVERVPQEGGRRTDVWRFDGRSPTYLIALIVAPLETIRSTWRDVVLEYSALPGHTEALKTSLAETPNMLEFFSDYLDAPYPWPRYAQTYVWDFVYGGMENVTATTLNMRALHTKAARPNYRSEGLVAHELAHMWFGDLLTCRTWEHIWLNEGFATYFTDLFFEHRYGRDEFLLRRRLQNQGYMRGTPKAAELKLEKQPRGDIPLELFGGKQYNRGAAILHNLRRHLGDEPFRAAVRAYVKRHRDNPVTSEDLRTTVESVAGEDLQWFWDQWVYGLGYPKLDVRYDERTKQLVVRQTQTRAGGQGLFRLRVPMRWGADGEVQELLIYRERHAFPMEEGGSFLRFGVGGDLLMKVTQQQSAAAWADALLADPDVAGRLDAAEALETFGPVAVPALAKALQEDASWAVREACADVLERLRAAGSDEALLAGASDVDSRVRARVVQALGSRNRRVAGAAVARLAREDPHPYVRAAAARAVGRLKVVGAPSLLHALLEVDSHGDVVRGGALAGLAHLGDRSAVERALPFLDYCWGKGANHTVRKEALDCVTALQPDDREVHEALVELLDDPYHSMRTWAAEACGKYGVKEAIPALQRLQRTDWHGGVRAAARTALQHLGVGDKQEDKKKAA